MMNPPRPEDFGFTAADIPAIEAEEQRLARRDDRLGYLLFVALYAIAVGMLWPWLRFAAFLFGLGAAFFYWLILGAIVWPLVDRARRDIKPSTPRARIDALHKFLIAKRQYGDWLCRTQIDFWQSLAGLAFEQEVRDLFVRSGIAAVLTPPSNDGGIDLILPDGVVVQCKSGKGCVRPAVARELYGAMVACDAPRGILIATGGFSPGVHDFVYDKPIELWEIDKLVEMQTRLGMWDAT